MRPGRAILPARSITRVPDPMKRFASAFEPAKTMRPSFTAAASASVNAESTVATTPFLSTMSARRSFPAQDASTAAPIASAAETP